MAAAGTSSKDEGYFRSGSMNLGGVTNPLVIKANAVRQERVNWQSYKQGQMISLEEYGVITRLDSYSSSVESRVMYLSSNADLAAKTFYRLTQHIAKDSTLQYLLVMIDDLLMEDHNRVEMFIQYANSVKESPWSGFLSLLNRKDSFIINQTATLITKMAFWSKAGMDVNNQKILLTWLRDQLRATSGYYLQSVCRCLQILLRTESYRLIFFDIDGVSVLVSALSGKIGFQLHYQLTFCIWCLTFNEDVCAILDKYGVIRVLSDIFNETVKEKVTRIILAVFRNMLEKPEERSVQQLHALSMVQNKIIKQLDILSDKKYDDEDISDDIKYISETLETSVQDLSSFDEYVSEIRSGRLEWSPVHKEIRFWRENAGRLNESNYELLKALIHLLNTSRDSLILSVAAHDVGEYVRHYPRGKHVLEQIGGKEAVMRHLSHEDPNVRYEALLSVQKLMVHNWEYLGKQLQEAAA